MVTTSRIFIYANLVRAANNIIAGEGSATRRKAILQQRIDEFTRMLAQTTTEKEMLYYREIADAGEEPLPIHYDYQVPIFGGGSRLVPSDGCPKCRSQHRMSDIATRVTHCLDCGHPDSFVWNIASEEGIMGDYGKYR